MEASRIDALARVLAGRTKSRRAALSLASLGTLAAALGRSGSPAEARLQLAATPIMSDSPTPTATSTIAPTASSTATATASPTRTPTATATTTVAAAAPLRVETTC